MCSSFRPVFGKWLPVFVRICRSLRCAFKLVGSERPYECHLDFDYTYDNRAVVSFFVSCRLGQGDVSHCLSVARETLEDGSMIIVRTLPLLAFPLQLCDLDRWLYVWRLRKRPHSNQSHL
jgi:hypothetical protein